MKYIENMTRIEVIKELCGKLSHETLSMIQWDSTAYLKAYLAYIREPDKEPRESKKAGHAFKRIPIKCGCGAPWEHTGKHWPDNTNRTGFLEYEISIDYSMPSNAWRLEPRDKQTMLKRIMDSIRRGDIHMRE